MDMRKRHAKRCHHAFVKWDDVADLIPRCMAIGNITEQELAVVLGYSRSYFTNARRHNKVKAGIQESLQGLIAQHENAQLRAELEQYKEAAGSISHAPENGGDGPVFVSGETNRDDKQTQPNGPGGEAIPIEPKPQEWARAVRNVSDGALITLLRSVSAMVGEDGLLDLVPFLDFLITELHRRQLHGIHVPAPGQ